MTTTIFRRLSLSVLALSFLTLGLGVLSAQEAETPCPFLDDEIILYHSPATLAQIPSIQKVWGCEEAQDALNIFFTKLDEGLAKATETENFPKDRQEYVGSVVCGAANDKSFSRALFSCYFRYVDGVVLALDLPKNDVKELPFGISLTYFIYEDPSALDVRKLFKEGEELEVVKQDDSKMIGKLLLKDKGELKATIFFGGTKIKDMDKYAIVFAGTQEGVEKKVERFQATNAFLAKRLAADRLYVDQIFKAELFEKLVVLLDGKTDDPRAKAVRDALAKVKSFNFKANGTDNGVCLSTSLEAVDAESAQTFMDLAVGGIAMIKLSTKDKTDLTKEQLFCLDLLKKIEFSHEAGSAVTSSSLNFDVDQMKAIVKPLIWDKIKECCNK